MLSEINFPSFLNSVSLKVKCGCFERIVEGSDWLHLPISFHFDLVRFFNFFYSANWAFHLPSNLLAALTQKRGFRWIRADDVRPTSIVQGSRPFRSNGLALRLRRHPSVPLCIVAAEKWSRFPSKVRAIQVLIVVAGRFLKSVTVEKEEMKVELRQSRWKSQVFMPTTRFSKAPRRSCGIINLFPTRANVFSQKALVARVCGRKGNAKVLIILFALTLDACLSERSLAGSRRKALGDQRTRRETTGGFVSTSSRRICHVAVPQSSC